ncbi:uncharacterized protein LOC120354188 isoform X2 [Nilaparvata lugens]|nr:uncharacterized protein LOC120354188 isoform X2 [Nilaparvata lugens]
MKWRLQQKKSKGEEKSGPSTSSTLESNLKNSVLDGTSDFTTIVPPIPSIGLQPALNDEIDTTSMRNSGVSYVESNVCDTLLTRYDEYPDLIVEPDGRPPKDDFNIISGRFIVDGKHIVQELRSLDYHRYECEKSDNGYMTLVSSTSKSLEWTMKFKCPHCQKCKVITSDPRPEVAPQECPSLQMTLIDEAVWGFASIGSGHRNMEEVLTTMNVLPPNEKTFKKTEERLGKVWQDVLSQSMKQAGMEEKQLAIANGDVTTNNIPHITVVVDGGWSHRSHGHRYSANSGVVCVIGLRTKKLLHIDVRNKYCSMCSYLERKGVSSVQHNNCYKNWDGASASMESDMVVSAFNSSEEIHGLQYRKFIDDGDSSVHQKVIEMVPYGRYVEKIECSNHMIKNYTKRLYKIREDGIVEKRVLNQSVIKRLKAAVRGSVAHYASDKNIEDLKRDLRNGPFHVLGYHGNCKSYFCKDIDTGSMIEGQTLNVLKKVEIALKPLLLKASMLWHNKTSNLAENYMSLVAKFCGGKQVNRGKRGSLNYRSNAAALEFQFGPMWHYHTMKEVLKKSPALLVKKTCLSRVKKNLSCRKSLLKRFRDGKKYDRRVKQRSTGLKDYGPLCQKIDMGVEEMEEEKTNLLKSLALSQDEKIKLELETRGQNENNRWLQERKLRVTASNFGLISKRLQRSKWAPVVKQLLYSKVSNDATLYGQLHEPAAINAFQEMEEIQVQPCGLFVEKNMTSWRLHLTDWSEVII